MSDRPLDAAQLEKRLETYLDPMLFPPGTASEPARALAAFSRREQEFVLHWGAVIARDNRELGYQFTMGALEGLRILSLEALESWVLQAMDLYDKQGQLPALRVFQQVRAFAAHLDAQRGSLMLEAVSGVLERFVCGLNGRSLHIAAGEAPFTDTETLFLPPILGRLAEKEENFRLYKAMVVHQWAQNWYGTWRGGKLFDALASGALSERELPWLHALETVRLDACIARDLPGLYRELQRLSALLDRESPDWQQATQALRRPGATLEDSLNLLPKLRAATPPERCYQGVLNPEAVRLRFSARVAQERDQFRILLAQLIEEQDGKSLISESPSAEILPETRARLALQPHPDSEGPEGFSYRLLLDGNPVTPPSALNALVESILQDQGEIPPEYLVAAGPGLYKRGAATQDQPETTVRSGEGVFLYDEWDHSRQHHRKDWCLLREHPVQPTDLGFYFRTLKKYSGLIKSLRRTFEVLRGEDQLRKRQSDGEDLDIDALVEAYGDVHRGLEMSERLFTRMHRNARSIAVLLLVDLSGSTQGWINEAEREALILLSEALETLEDRFAIYGFSGWTRTQCEVYVVKRFDEPYGETVQGRICNLSPKDYTRMGAPIRHLSRLLEQQEARTKLLITLSDGKPDDYDAFYRGEYGIEDTRQALLEARLAGIHPFCITIDEAGPEYLPHMYGPANYTLVSDIGRLPAKVAEIYRKLTRP